MSSVCTTIEKKDESVLLHKYREQVKLVEDKTGINGKYLITGMLSVGLLVFLGVFEAFLTNLSGTLLPAYLSLKSIESLESDIEKQWITYWVVFSAYNLLDKFAVFFIFYFPFYYFIKYLILAWLFLPNFNGAAYFYDKALLKWFKKLEAIVEKQNGSKKKISDAVIETNMIVTENTKTNVEKTVQITNPNLKISTDNYSSNEKKPLVVTPSKSNQEQLSDKKNS